jgi:phosphohistidine phosphatase
VDLYLVRHAVAYERDPARWPDDSRRPLTEEGERRFRAACRGLRAVAPDVALVLSSGCVRAWRTAELLHEEAGWPAPVECPALESGHEPPDVLEALRPHAVESVALVGHEPDLSALAAYLLCGPGAPPMVEMKKGGVALLSFPSRPRAGEGTLRWLLTPRLLRALGR